MIKFEQDNLTINVNVSPREETVWLTLNDLCILFDRDKSVISRHIKNVFKENELYENQVVAKNATTASDGKKYEVTYYNLDMIISIGYRVKSKNGIIFRKWANSVLKEYLLKGYIINENRTLVTNENYINLINEVHNIDTRLSKLESDNRIDNERLFFDGEYFDARVFIKSLILKANNRIILVDPYSDSKTLDYLKENKNNVSILLYTSSLKRPTQDDIDSFNVQYGGLSVYIVNTFHDRFLIIDDKTLYHLGASLNYVGKKTFAISTMNDDVVFSSIMAKIESIN